MDSFDKDKKFLIEVIGKIVNYANDNGMEPDETIKTIAENMINLLEYPRLIIML